MAGERLYSEFKDDKGDVWRVSIYDTNAVWNPANAESFKLGGEGFVIRYNGANETAHQPIIGSSVEFTLYEEIADHTQTLDLLYSDSEGRLLLEIYRDPDGDNTIYWRGVVLADQVERNDEPTPTPVRLTASDDIGNLKDVPFSRSLGQTVLSDIVRCLTFLRTSELYAAGDAFVRYINDTELYAASDDTNPLDTIISSVPLKMSDDGTAESYNCFEILHSLATCFNARVFQAEGVWWFWPINVHKRAADGTAISTLVKQYDKTKTAVSWTASDIAAMNTAYVQTSGTEYNKLAGHVFTHLPPVESVIRSRRTNGNLYIVSGSDDTVITSGQNITLSDDGRTYDATTKFQVSGQVLFNVSADASFDFGFEESRVRMELELMLNVDSKYYEPEQWTTDSSDRYVIDLSGFDRSNGCNLNTMFSFITDELPSDEDGLDVTAVVKFFDLTGANVTASYTSEDFYLFLAVTYVDGDTGNPDLIRFKSEGNSDNVLSIDQGEILHGDRDSFSAQGSFSNTNNQWKSSQTAGPLSVHRLGVNEALARQRFATKIHRGTVYGLIEMWHTMLEDSEYYIPFELSTVMNTRETTVERYKIAYDSSGITNADDEVRREVNRGNMVDFVNATANTITSQVQQPKPSAGLGPVAPTGGRAIQLDDTQGPIHHRVFDIEHTSGSTYTIAADDYGYVYMNSYVDSATGYGGITLPKVADSEGRVLKFKTDDTIHANKYVKVGLAASEIADGVLIDGETSFDMDRDYDGITVMCHDGQWYVIQRKGKGGGDASLSEEDQTIAEGVTRQIILDGSAGSPTALNVVDGDGYKLESITAYGTGIVIQEKYGALAVRSTALQQGSLNLYEAAANGASYTTLKSNASLTSNVVLTLPNSGGSSGDYLTNAGGGIMQWTTPTPAVSYFTIQSSFYSSDGNGDYIPIGGTLSETTTNQYYNRWTAPLAGEIVSARVFTTGSGAGSTTISISKYPIPSTIDSDTQTISTANDDVEFTFSTATFVAGDQLRFWFDPTGTPAGVSITILVKLTHP